MVATVEEEQKKKFTIQAKKDALVSQQMRKIKANCSFSRLHVSEIQCLLLLRDFPLMGNTSSPFLEGRKLVARDYKVETIPPLFVCSFIFLGRNGYQ